MSRHHRYSRALHGMRRLLVIPLRDLGDLLIAQTYLLLALRAVRHRPKGGLLRRVGLQTGARGVPDERRLARLAVAVDRVARHGCFRPTCLVRAVALERMIRLTNAGPAIVRVGVARQPGGFFAHAWVELEGRVVGDELSFVRRFTPLEDFSALAS
jgi:hypothetical protein